MMAYPVFEREPRFNPTLTVAGPTCTQWGLIQNGTIIIMRSTRFRTTTESKQVSEAIDSQIARLRQILLLMAPESGSSALGAMRQAAPKVPLADRVRLLTEYRR